MHEARYSLSPAALISIAMLLMLLPLRSGIASTIAMVSGDATVDGRPLLMKARDNSSNPNQEYIYGQGALYSYIGVTYAGVTDQIYGGVNNVGFAVNNANAWNFDDLVPGPDDDGYIMILALSTCLTVDDFELIMDSTDVTGRTLPAIYGVLDASGQGAFFEAAAYEHYRYDLDDSTAAPNGYMVRANFAYAGGPYHLGQHRHDRVLALLDSAYAGNFITHQYITASILRDIVNEETNPYPLPFQGTEGLMPFGLLHTHDAINRDITRSAFVIQGIQPGEDPLLCTLWAMVGEPISTVALPLWVRAGSVPVEFDGPDSSALNLKAQLFKDYIYEQQWASDGLDTWKMVDERGQGLLPYLIALENQASASGDSALGIWRIQGMPDPIQVQTLQNGVASWTLAQLDSWGPPQSPDVDATWLSSGQVRLDWQPVTLDVFNRLITVSSYTIYTSDQPFLDRLAGDSLTTVSSPPVLLSGPQTSRFFQVRCRP